MTTASPDPEGTNARRAAGEVDRVDAGATDAADSVGRAPEVTPGSELGVNPSTDVGVGPSTDVTAEVPSKTDTSLGEGPMDQPVSDAEVARRGRLAAREAERELARELEDTPPGPVLAARVVELVSEGGCSQDTMVEMIAALGRCVANLEGLRAALVWSTVEPHDGDTLEIRSAIEEIAVRIGHTYGTVGRMLDLGMGMAASPDLGAAVRDGRLGSAKATQILRDTEHLDPDRRDHVIGEVISRDPETRNLPDLRRFTRTLAECIDPLDAAARHARARANRCVWIDKARHGMAFLHAYLPAIDAYQVYATLTTMALAQDPDLADDLSPGPMDGPHDSPPGSQPDHQVGDGLPLRSAAVVRDPAEPPDSAEPVHHDGWPSDGDEPVDLDVVPPEVDREEDKVDVPWLDDTFDGDTAGTHAVEVTRTLGNRRADALRDLFKPSGPFATGRPFDAVRPRLVVVARAEALLGSDQFPGELIGYGTLPAHALRQIAGDATWQAIYADPHTGRMVAAGTRLLSPGLTTPADPPHLDTPSPLCIDPPDGPRVVSTHGGGTPIDHTAHLRGAGTPLPDSSRSSPPDPPPLLQSDLTRLSLPDPPRPSPPDPSSLTPPDPPRPIPLDLPRLFPPEAWPAETMACHSYRPSSHIQTTITLRDQSCRFPGCQRAAWACDLDHIQSFDPGQPAIDQTVASNLQPLCRVHHRLKTLAGWDWTRNTYTGVLTITSPAGRIYRLLAVAWFGDVGVVEGVDVGMRMGPPGGGPIFMVRGWPSW
ncbi:MAG: HNH endonuclease [Bifidobacteriaceae bacterium]|jgi:hypothetical protein|nr:HNH endonuclease [Bifidobacteriaceae bacterium]